VAAGEWWRRGHASRVRVYSPIRRRLWGLRGSRLFGGGRFRGRVGDGREGAGGCGRVRGGLEGFVGRRGFWGGLEEPADRGRAGGGLEAVVGCV